MIDPSLSAEDISLQRDTRSPVIDDSHISASNASPAHNAPNRANRENLAASTLCLSTERAGLLGGGDVASAAGVIDPCLGLIVQ
jgi:hypothetical protein